MIPDHTEPDAELQRILARGLRRHVAPSPTFTNRVVGDLTRHGLVRRSPFAFDARWLAAAAVIFALGFGAGAAMTSRPVPVAPSPTPVSAATTRVAADVNVPPVGKSEVWF